jgi:hypothetical protein
MSLGVGQPSGGRLWRRSVSRRRSLRNQRGAERPPRPGKRRDRPQREVGRGNLAPRSLRRSLARRSRRPGSPGAVRSRRPRPRARLLPRPRRNQVPARALARPGPRLVRVLAATKTATASRSSALELRWACRYRRRAERRGDGVVACCWRPRSRADGTAGDQPSSAGNIALPIAAAMRHRLPGDEPDCIAKACPIALRTEEDGAELRLCAEPVPFNHSQYGRGSRCLTTF